MTTYIFTLILLLGCKHADTTINQKKSLGSDYRLFKNTPAWQLAKSVKEGDTSAIHVIARKNKELIDYRDPVYKQTLLKIAVYNRNYNSVEALLKCGANPNDQLDRDKMSPLMEAASLGGGGNKHPFADTRFLTILLKYGGNPNAVQNGDEIKKNRTFFTPLALACLSGVFEYVKILVEAGAKINYVDKDGGNSLFASIIGGNPEITLFLLKNGADFKMPMYTNIKGEKKYILDALTIWHFENRSEEYKKKLKVLDFLKDQGIQ